MLRLRALLTLLVSLALTVAAACEDASTVARQSGVTGGPTATPASLGVTPETPQYRVRDPAFEPLPGARALYGTYEGGAYQIEVPADWNGRLVLWAHGFRGFGDELVVDIPPPMREYFIANGYAWGASSYRANGYVPGFGALDTLALKDLFEREVGRPERVYLVGASMGGNVVTLSLERAPDAYDGALALCGVTSGSEILDFFASWGALAAYFAGVDMAGLANDPEALAEGFRQRVLPALGEPPELTEAGRRFENVIMHLSGGPRPFFEEGFADRYDENFELVIASLASRASAVPVAGNVGYEYHIDPGFGIADEALNAGVPRLAPDEDARRNSTFGEFAPMTGAIEDPLLTLHNTGDLFVPFALELTYRRTVQAAGRDHLLVQRAVRRAGHCNFTADEVRIAFEDLVRWLEEGVRPEGDDLSGDLTDAGLRFTVPLEPDDPAAP
ncbi:MAG TPA: esterase [Dehalococcoidia bacterium]|nr:esterase [Dehalococcoidia bacterium]